MHPLPSLPSFTRFQACFHRGPPRSVLCLYADLPYWVSGLGVLRLFRSEEASYGQVTRGGYRVDRWVRLFSNPVSSTVEATEEWRSHGFNKSDDVDRFIRWAAMAASIFPSRRTVHGLSWNITYPTLSDMWITRLTATATRSTTRCGQCREAYSKANDGWEVVIGLEIHAQLKAKTKLFSRGCAETPALKLTCRRAVIIRRCCQHQCRAARHRHTWLPAGEPVGHISRRSLIFRCSTSKRSA